MPSEIFPRVKPIFPRFKLGDTIHVQICGSTLDIPDEDGRISTLLALMDGSRSTTVVFNELTQEFPETTLEEFNTAVADLDQLRLLDDARRDVDLSEYDRERWNRDRGFFETYAQLGLSKFEIQERVQGASVALLGLGGVGSHILMDLLGLGVRNIRIVDYDKIELSNLNRQVLYRHSDIGRRKVEAAKERALAYQPSAQIDAIELKMVSAEDVASVVADRDVVIAAVDTPKMHIANWVNAGCVRSGATLLTGGVDLQRAIHYTIIPGVTGCVECWRLQVEEDPADAALNAEMNRVQTQLQPGERFGQDFAAFGGLVAVQTACLVTEFVRVTSGVTPPIAAGRLMEVRFEDLALREAESWKRLDSCSVCGTLEVPHVAI